MSQIRKLIALGENYARDVKHALIGLSETYSKFEYQGMDFSLASIAKARGEIASGDSDAIKEALSRDGNFTKPKELPKRPYLAHLPKYRQWNSLPLSKRVKGFINGS